MSIPTLPLLGLSTDELAICERLQQRLMFDRFFLNQSDAYYNGTQRLANLNISVPPELVGLHTVIGWPAIGIDEVDSRLSVAGFFLPGSSEVDETLWAMWQANSMDEEASLAFLEARIFGRSYICIGSGENDGDMPVITVESPQNMAVDWDARTRTVIAAYRLITFQGKSTATLYLPNETIFMQSDSQGNRIVTNRDQHNLGIVPVVRMANRQRSNDRHGQSDITPAVRNLTDACCRTLLSMEVAREFHAVPQRVVLGAALEQFTNSDGSPKPGWETYIGRYLLLESDDEGHVPSVTQFTPMDPAVYTKIIDTYAKIMAPHLHVPAQYLGWSAEGNPTSADAIRASEVQLVGFTEKKQRIFSGPLEDAMRIGLLIRDGEIDPAMYSLETEWASAATPTPGATTDAITKQIASKVLPASSDVALKQLGYGPQQRAQIKLDRERERQNAEQDVAHQLLATIDPAAAAQIDKAA